MCRATMKSSSVGHKFDGVMVHACVSRLTTQVQRLRPRVEPIAIATGRHRSLESVVRRLGHSHHESFAVNVVWSPIYTNLSPSKKKAQLHPVSVSNQKVWRS